jgi:hypothetical protein
VLILVQSQIDNDTTDMTKVHRAPSNSNFLGLLMEGGGDSSAGLLLNVQRNINKEHGLFTHIDVPQFAAGFPMMILSDTPAILSFFPNAEASNRWSVVFSNEASMSTLSFIFATPKRVIPRTSPYKSQQSRSSLADPECHTL